MTGISEKDIAKALQRPGALPAFLTALGILAALIVQGFLTATFVSLSVIADSSLDSDFFGQLWAGQLVGSLAGPVPITIGLFLCFWQVAPIAANLRLAHVVTRALLAATAGMALLFVLGLIYLFVLWLLSLGGAFDGGGLERVAPIGPSVLGVLFRSLGVLVGVIPVVVLGAVLLWGWLQRHPLKQAVKGTIDEV